MSDHAQKIISLEASANLQDEHLASLEASSATLAESNAKLLAKVSDLESRSRRNNIRVVGVPESVEGPRPTTFFAELLMEVFGEGFLESPPDHHSSHAIRETEAGTETTAHHH